MASNIENLDISRLNIKEMEDTIKGIEPKSYILTYPHLISFFETKEELSESDFVIGAHMVYGWMPTMLKKVRDFTRATELLNNVKKGAVLTNIEIEELKYAVNNSVIGASKLLHFVAPENYPIWDSKVYKFLCKEGQGGYKVNNVDLYISYYKIMEEKKRENIFHKELGCDVTEIRAMEMIMYEHVRQEEDTKRAGKA